MGKITLPLLAACMLQVLLAAGAEASTVRASASYSFPGPPGSVSYDFRDENSSTISGTTVSAVADIASATYSPYATTIEGHASASASESDLKAGASLSINNFDTSIVGEGIFISANAFLNDSYTTSSLTDLYASPIFQLTGSLVTSSPDVSATASLYSYQLGGYLFSETATTTPLPVDGIFTPTSAILIPAGGFLSTNLSLSTSIETSIPPLVDGGNYSADVDFTGTLSLLGIALFEDAGMTIPILEGVTVQSSNHNPISVIPVPGVSAVPLPPAAWLFASALAGLAGLRRRGKSLFFARAG